MARYELTEQQKARLENDYTYHPPFGDQQEAYIAVRAAVKHLARTILEQTPVSREQSLALTQLDFCMMAANSAIARNEKSPIPTEQRDVVRSGATPTGVVDTQSGPIVYSDADAKEQAET